MNTYLALNNGNYSIGLGTSLHSPYKLTFCLKASNSFANYLSNNEEYELCLVKRNRPGFCKCEYSINVMSTITDDLTKCMNPPIPEMKEMFKIEQTISDEFRNVKRNPFVPIRLRALLSSLAIDNTIIMTAATFTYRDIIMAFVCNLRNLHVTNFIIFALDYGLYEYLFVRSIPVHFMDIPKLLNQTTDISWNLDLPDCSIFKSSCYKTITKLKSRNVLQVLKLGYNVSSYYYSRL